MKKKRYVQIGMVALVLIACVGVYIVAKYVLEEETSWTGANAPAFYLTSDYLYAEGTDTLYDAPQGTDISFDIRNYKDILNWTETDLIFNLEITVDTSEASENIDGNSTLFSDGVSVATINSQGTTKTYSFTIEESNNEVESTDFTLTTDAYPIQRKKGRKCPKNIFKKKKIKFYFYIERILCISISYIHDKPQQTSQFYKLLE